MARVIRFSEMESMCCSAPLLHHSTKSPYNSCTKCKSKCTERIIGAPVVEVAADPYKRGYEDGQRDALAALLKKSVKV